MLQILSKYNINTPLYFHLPQGTSDYIYRDFQCVFLLSIQT